MKKKTFHNQPHMQAVADQLEGLSFKPGKEIKIERGDLLSLDEAYAITGKKSLKNPKLWSKDAVFIGVKTLVKIYGALDEDGRTSMTQDELFGGWFEGGPADDDCVDDEGDFCSTPCHDDDAPPVREFKSALNECAICGLVFAY